MILKYSVWAVLLVLQQLTQTLSMRSRASGSYRYHAFCATGSNAVWWVSQMILVDIAVGVLAAKAWWTALLLGMFYCFWCVAGSTLGMWLAIKAEHRYHITSSMSQTPAEKSDQSS